jgi:hypothetical protein
LTSEFGIGSNGYMNKSPEKFIKDRPYATAEAAAERLLEIAKTLRIDDGLMPIGEWNSTFIWKDKASVAEYTLGRDKLIADGVIKMHECGGFFKWLEPGADGQLPGTNPA